MQQLNVLSMKISQNIDNKDDSDALISGRSKDDFSQHIDLQLSKNKQSPEPDNTILNDKTVSNDKTSLKPGKSTIEQKTIRTDDKTLDKSDYHQAVVDNVDSATHVQEVAAYDNQDEIDTSTVNADDKKIIDESELLMTFLTKVDQTLVTEVSANKAVPSAVDVNKMSDEKIIKFDTKPLLTPDDLVTDLSSVAKAVSSTTEVTEPTEVEIDTIQGQGKLINSLTSEDKNTGAAKENSINENIITNQVNSKQAVYDESSTVDELATGKLMGSVQDNVSTDSVNNLETNLTKLAEQIAVSSKGEDTSHKKAVNTAIESQSTIPADTEIKSNKLPQNIMMASKDASSNNVNISAKEVLGTSIGTDDDSVSKVKSKINESLINTENGVSLLKSDSTAAEVDIVVGRVKTQSAVAKNNDNLTSQVIDKNTIAANLGQASAESTVEDVSMVEPEEELNEQSMNKFIEQNKIVDTEGDKRVNNKANATVDITDSHERSNFIGEASKATQDAYDRVEQQSSDALALTTNSETVQNQKTNIQLHQETISIFRRDFADAVKDKVMLIISQKLQQFDITLDPPELGNVQVRVNLQGEQATVNFVVQNQQAKEAFEQNMHKLRDLLAEQGVDVGDANVEQQSQQSDAEASSGGNQGEFSQKTADANDVVEHSLSARMSDTSSKGIDYYA